MSVPLGSTVRFSCSTLYYHAFELCSNSRIKWIKDDQYLQEKKYKYTMYSCGVLHVLSVDLEDTAEYRCEITLKATEEEFVSPPGFLKVLRPSSAVNFSLEVERTLYLPPSPPSLMLNTPPVVEVILGNNAVLECLTNDHDDGSKVTWKRADGRLMRSQGVVTENDETLIISRATAEDEGTYKCSLDVPSEEDLGYRLTRLSVLRPPELLSFPKSMMLRNGDLARFNCSAAGVPPPSVEFYKDGIPYATGGSITQSGPYRSLRSSNTTIVTFVIMIVQQKDEGIYQCIASNKAGMTSRTTKLNWIFDANAPGLPTKVSVKDANSTSILFQWQPPANLGSESGFIEYNYDVFFGRADSNQHTDEVLKFDVLEKRYTKLQPNTNYTFYIRVLAYRNDTVVMSGLTNKLYHVTEMERPTILSAKVTLTVLDPTALKVQWKPLPIKGRDRQSVKVEQRIQWWSRGVDQLPSIRILRPKVSEYNITDVPAQKTEVKVLIKCPPWLWSRQHLSTKANFNVVDISEWTKVGGKKQTVSLKEEEFEIFLISNSSTSVLIEWTTPRWINIEDPAYNLTYINTNDVVKIFSFTVEDTNHYLLDGLEPGCYSFILSVAQSTSINDYLLKTEAKICTFIHSTLLKDRHSEKPWKFMEDQKHTEELLIWNINILNYTSTSITLEWTPSERSKPDFFLVMLDEIQNGKKSEPGKSKDSSVPVQNSRKRKDNNYLQSVSYHKKYDIDIEKISTTDVPYEVVKSSLLTLTRNSVRLINLKPVTKYKILVAASTINRVGEPISPLYVTTLEGVPSAPLHFMWFPLTTSSVNVSWTAPIETNGFLSQYLILYSQDRAKWENITVPADSRFATLTGLISNIKYSVLVAGVTSAGSGDHLEGEVIIQAVLDQSLVSSRMSLEMIIICVISTLVIITCIVLTFLITTTCRQRQRSALRLQGSSSPSSRVTFPKSDIKEKNFIVSAENSNFNHSGPVSDAATVEISTRHLDTKGRQNIEENISLLQKQSPEEVSTAASGGRDQEIPSTQFQSPSNHSISRRKGNSLSSSRLKDFSRPDRSSATTAESAN